MRRMTVGVLLSLSGIVIGAESDSVVLQKMKESLSKTGSFEAEYVVVTTTLADMNNGRSPAPRVPPGVFTKTFTCMENPKLSVFRITKPEGEGSKSIKVEAGKTYLGQSRKISTRPAPFVPYEVSGKKLVSEAGDRSEAQQKYCDRLLYGEMQRYLGAMSPLAPMGVAGLDLTMTLDKPTWIEWVKGPILRPVGLLFAHSDGGAEAVNGVATEPFDLLATDWGSDVIPKPGDDLSVSTHPCRKPSNYRALSRRLLYKVWLAPEYGYLPVRMDTFESSVLMERREVSSYIQISPGAWFPVQGAILTLNPLGSSKEFTTKDVLKKVEINVVRVNAVPADTK